MGTTAADPRERRRVLQTGGNDLKPKSAPRQTDRSALPGFGSAGAASSVAKKQQAKNSKLNTPTKKNTTPPPAAPAAAAGARDVPRSRDAKTVAAPAAATHLAGDPYEFPADDCDEEDAGNRQQQAGTAAASVKQQQQQPRAAAAAAGTKPKPSGRLGALGALGFGVRGGINNSSASRQLFSSVNGVAHAPYAGGSSAAAAGFASANAVVGTCMAGGQAGRVKKQVDIRGFTEPLPLLSSPTRYNGKLPAGMLNHGNTCYLNAVLQALLSLPCLGRDLTGDSLAQLPLPPYGVTLALQTCLKQHTASCGAISPAAVGAAMAQLSSRWGGCRQEDAHEFLTALLEAVQTEVLAAQVRQLKSIAAPSSSSNSEAPPAAAAAGAVEAADSAMPDAHAEAEADPQQHDEQHAAAAAVAEPPELAAAAAEQAARASATAAAAAAPGGPRLRVSAALCPASRNFSGCLQHTLTCSECGHVTLVKEQFNHLSLDLPAPAGSSAGVAGAGSAPGSPARGISQQQQQRGDGELKWSLSGGVDQPADAAGGSSSDSPLVPDLQALLANFFAQETLEKACEACGAASTQHSLTHAVRRLPRVLVVHLKRFQWQVLPGGGAICRKLSTRVRPDRQLHLGAVCCPGRPVPPLLAELMPAGLLQAADAACTAEPCGSSGLAGSKRSRGDVDELHAAADDIVDVDAGDDLEIMWKPGSSKQQQQVLQPHKQATQQELPQAWAAAAAGGGAGKPAAQQGQQSRLSRMSQADQQQQQQQGSGYSRKPVTLDGSLFGDRSNVFTGARPEGGHHTDLTQVQQQQNQQQQRPRKRSKSPPEADIRASGELCIKPADAEGADAYGLGGEGCGLPRNNSSTHVVDLASLEDEDDDLQRAIKASLLTAAQEGHPTDTTSCKQPAQPQQPAELSMPQRMNASGTLGAGAECSTPPSTPTSQGFAPLPALLQPHRQDADDQLHSWVPVGDAVAQQQRAGSGGLSGGAAGLFDGLAFSDERPAAPRQQQQQGDWCMPAGTPFAGLQRIGLGGSSGALAPGSPARAEQPQPARGRNVSNSSGAGGPFASQLHRSSAAGGGGGAAGAAGAAGSTVSSLLDGMGGMTEEQQLKRAMELSLMESAAGNAAAAAGGGAAAAGGIAGLVDKDGYDEEAALQRALEESAAAAEMQLLQQQVLDAEAAGKQQGSGEPGGAAQQQQQGAEAGSEAAAGSGDGDGGYDDDAVVVAESGAGGDGGQQRQRQRLPLVRLVEDSDCEDEDCKAAPTAASAAAAVANAIEQAAPAAAAASTDPEAMQVDRPEQLPAAAASQQQQLGKENQEEEQQQHGAAGSAATRSKPKRRPLGEVLCSRDAARANSSRGSALAAADAAAAPVKQPNLAAAVAASEAAAAAASSGAGGQAGELAAVHAAAAAQAAGAWPQQSAALYRLRAVVRHKGPLASSGHFVSEVLSDQQGGQWFHYDDSFVQPTKLQTVVRRCEADGYLFFYINSAILGGSQQQH